MSRKWVLGIGLLCGLAGAAFNLKQQSSTLDVIAHAADMVNTKAPYQEQPGVMVEAARAEGYTLIVDYTLDADAHEIAAAASEIRSNAQTSSCLMMSELDLGDLMQMRLNMTAKDGRQALAIDIKGAECA